MSIWSHNGRGLDQVEALDDAAVDELVEGRYDGDAPELVAASRLVEHVRSFAEGPASLPSPALGDMLSGSAPGSGDVLRLPRRAPVRHRPRLTGVPTVAAAVAAALIAVIVAAGAARLLPGPAQELVASVVRALTPFDLPRQQEPEAVLARAQRPGALPSSDDPPGARAAPPPGGAEAGTSGDPTTGSGDGGRRPPSGSLTPAPTPSTTVTPRQAPAGSGTAPPTVPATGGRDPGGVTGPAPPAAPPPAPEPGRITADLVGQRAGGGVSTGSVILDTDPGRNELCLTLTLSGIAPVTSVHLHAGSAGVSGPVVATFAAPLTAGTSRVCATVTDQVMKEIRDTPGNYYVDVHTADPLNGTLRGQLTT